MWKVADNQLTEVILAVGISVIGNKVLDTVQIKALCFVRWDAKESLRIVGTGSGFFHVFFCEFPAAIGAHPAIIVTQFFFGGFTGVIEVNRIFAGNLNRTAGIDGGNIHMLPHKFDLRILNGLGLGTHFRTRDKAGAVSQRADTG